MSEAIKLPLTIEFCEEYPFRIIINDADGGVFLNESRYAHSSRQKTLDDCRKGIGFHHDNREAVISKVAAQEDHIEFIVRACNNQDELVTALEEWRADFCQEKCEPLNDGSHWEECETTSALIAKAKAQ